MATGYQQEVDFGRVEWNVLDHRFFARWAGGELRFDAAEELRQVSCWRAFSRSVGWGGMGAWMYAVQSAVSEVMRNALLRHYGFEDGPATEYFRLHAELADDWPSSRSAEVHRSYWLLLDGVEALGARGA